MNSCLNCLQVAVEFWNEIYKIQLLRYPVRWIQLFKPFAKVPCSRNMSVSPTIKKSISTIIILLGYTQSFDLGFVFVHAKAMLNWIISPLGKSFLKPCMPTKMMTKIGSSDWKKIFWMLWRISHKKKYPRKIKEVLFFKHESVQRIKTVVLWFDRKQ